MIREAIILAGGLGTRLRPLVSDRPKSMAMINGKPFLHFLISHLRKEGIEKIIFSVGYLHEVIEEYVKEVQPAGSYGFAFEDEPLGTGGAIRLAAKMCVGEHVLICNGDTLFNIDVSYLANFHFGKKAGCTVVLKPMQDFDRYGVVELNDDRSILSFKEKSFYAKGYINGGVYAVHLPGFLSQEYPDKFSFEKDYLEKKAGPPGENASLFGQVQDRYFIDIGIPEDYERAQQEVGV